MNFKLLLKNRDYAIYPMILALLLSQWCCELLEIINIFPILLCVGALKIIKWKIIIGIIAIISSILIIVIKCMSKKDLKAYCEDNNKPEQSKEEINRSINQEFTEQESIDINNNESLDQKNKKIPQNLITITEIATYDKNEFNSKEIINIEISKSKGQYPYVININTVSNEQIQKNTDNAVVENIISPKHDETYDAKSNENIGAQDKLTEINEMSKVNKAQECKKETHSQSTEKIADCMCKPEKTISIESTADNKKCISFTEETLESNDSKIKSNHSQESNNKNDNTENTKIENISTYIENVEDSNQCETTESIQNPEIDLIDPVCLNSEQNEYSAATKIPDKEHSFNEDIPQSDNCKSNEASDNESIASDTSIGNDYNKIPTVCLSELLNRLITQNNIKYILYCENDEVKVVLDDNSEYDQNTIYISRWEKKEEDYFFITVPNNFLPKSIRKSYNVDEDDPKRLSKEDFNTCISFIDKKISKHLNNETLPFLDNIDRIVPCCNKSINRIGIFMSSTNALYEDCRQIKGTRIYFIDRVDALYFLTLTYNYSHPGFFTLVIVQ